MLTKRKNTFYCFSPPVMIATFLIEIGLLFYTLYRYKMSPIARVVCALLGLLALFQLSEFAVCGADSSIVNTWSRIGFMSIALLPPLGLHLIGLLSKRVPKWLIGLAYGSGFAFALAFGLHNSSFEGHACAGNYAIFQIASGLGGAFFLYYYGWLIIGITLALYFSISAAKNIRKALILHTFGYLSILIPTGITNTLQPETIRGIPSIMCGFAVIYALTLVFGIVPLALSARNKPAIKK